MSAIGLATKGMITMSRIIKGSGDGGGGDSSFDVKKEPKVYFKKLEVNEVSKIEEVKEEKIRIKIDIIEEDED